MSGLIYVGIDDTDTEETRGTNQLAKHLVRTVAHEFDCVWIARHQLLFDPRVPYTSKNGSASLVFKPRGVSSLGDLAATLERLMRDDFIPGSDPGLCVTSIVPAAVTAFAHRCQHEVVTQDEARDLARDCGILLKGLGGTEGGVIGALAAVGLAITGDDGRVVQLGAQGEDLGGVQTLTALAGREVEVRQTSGDVVTSGLVDVGKKLRPNLRAGRFVLFVEPQSAPDAAAWRALKLV